MSPFLPAVVAAELRQPEATPEPRRSSPGAPAGPWRGRRHSSGHSGGRPRGQGAAPGAGRRQPRPGTSLPRARSPALGFLGRRQRPGLAGLADLAQGARVPAPETMSPWERSAEDPAGSVGACSHGDAGHFRPRGRPGALAKRSSHRALGFPVPAGVTLVTSGSLSNFLLLGLNRPLLLLSDGLRLLGRKTREEGINPVEGWKGARLQDPTCAKVGPAAPPSAPPRTLHAGGSPGILAPPTRRKDPDVPADGGAPSVLPPG